MKYVLTLILGILVGGAASYFLFVGAPRARMTKGEPVKAPDPLGPPPGTAVVELDEQFFKTLLDSIFRDLNKPAFPPVAGEGCQNQVVIEPAAGDVQTGVLVRDGRVVVPLAFSGTYNLMGCQNMRGTAEAGIDFRFAPDEQTLYGQLNVAGVNVEGWSPLLSGPLTAFVQGAINQRVNPLVLMRGQQLTLNIPVQAAGGTLRAQAREVREEAKDGKLRLHVTYDFTGAKGGAPPPG
ncbi:MAG TPA: hypothetical protein VGX48_09575 [Pyrinomonadaceae bacterium]|jgi:hypothetical protein|nr:hypothetical protein [Pyrinomonadaceae bacterium]